MPSIVVMEVFSGVRQQNGNVPRNRHIEVCGINIVVVNIYGLRNFIHRKK